MPDDASDRDPQQYDEPSPELPRRRAESSDEDVDVTQDTGSGREAYNVVSDTVVGVNFRLSDNCFQAVFIFASLLIGAVVGAFVSFPAGIVIGGFIGVVAGLLLSGAGLMVFRATRHVQGKHD